MVGQRRMTSDRKHQDPSHASCAEAIDIICMHLEDRQCAWVLLPSEATYVAWLHDCPAAYWALLLSRTSASPIGQLSYAPAKLCLVVTWRSQMRPQALKSGA